MAKHPVKERTGLPDKDLQKVSIQLKWYPQFQFAGYYAAKHKGFYQDRGLDVSILPYTPGLDIVDSVVSGKSDFGIADTGILLEFVKGKPVVVLAVIFQHSPSVILSRKDSGIMDPHDLIGKRVMISEKGEPDLHAMLMDEGVPYSRILHAELTWDIEELIDGRIDAMAAYVTNSPYELIRRDIPYSVITPRSYGIDFYGDCIFTSKNYADKNPEISGDFLQASLQGWEYAMAHPEEIADLILHHYGAKKNLAHLLYEAETMQKLIFPELVQIGHMNPGRWRHIAATYKRLGLIKEEKTELNGFLYTPVTHMDKAFVRRMMLWTGLVVVIAIFAISWFWFFNRRLKQEVRRQTKSLVDLNDKLLDEIKKREESQKYLFESRETANALINASKDSAFLLDKMGIVLAVNDIAAKRFGKTPTDLIGKSIYGMLPEEVAGNRKQRMEYVITNRMPYEFEDERNQMVFEHKIFPVFDEEKKVNRLAVFARDITLERRARDEIMKLSRAVEQSSAAVIITDQEGCIEYVNPRYTQITGFGIFEVLGKKPNMVKSDYHDEDFYKELWETILSGRVWKGEFYNKRKDGTLYWDRASISPVIDEHGKIRHFIGIQEDVTAKKEAEDALMESETRLRAITESAYDAIVVVNSEDSIRFWNKAAEKMFGYTKEEVMGKSLHDLISLPEEQEKARKMFPVFAKTGKGDGVGAIQEFMAVRKNRETFYVERTLSSFNLGGEWWAAGTVRDISRRKEDEEKLIELATIDGLTRIYNRRHFMELASLEVEKAERYGFPLAMIIYDIDHFKSINDTFGHDAGDRVLYAVTRTSRNCLRRVDIFGRIGGEEFAVLLPNTPKQTGFDIAERLRESIENTPVFVGEKEVHLTISAGVAFLCPGKNDLPLLMKAADTALYHAKESGRNQVAAAEE